MLAGHETTAKTVGIPSLVALPALTDSLVDLCTLGAGQAPGLSGETACGDKRDFGEGQGER